MRKRRTRPNKPLAKREITKARSIPGLFHVQVTTASGGGRLGAVLLQRSPRQGKARAGTQGSPGRTRLPALAARLDLLPLPPGLAFGRGPHSIPTPACRVPAIPPPPAKSLPIEAQPRRETTVAIKAPTRRTNDCIVLVHPYKIRNKIAPVSSSRLGPGFLAEKPPGHSLTVRTTSPL